MSEMHDDDRARRCNIEWIKVEGPMTFPAPRRWYLHPFRCFWVAVWNTHETVPHFLPKRLSPWLFGKALGVKGQRV